MYLPVYLHSVMPKKHKDPNKVNAAIRSVDKEVWRRFADQAEERKISQAHYFHLLLDGPDNKDKK